MPRSGPRLQLQAPGCDGAMVVQLLIYRSAASLALERVRSVDNFKNCTDTTVLPLEYPYNLAEDFEDFDEV